MGPRRPRSPRKVFPILTSDVAKISAIGLGASREQVHASSPTSKERAVASIESCATVELWHALSSGDMREESTECVEGMDRSDAYEVNKSQRSHHNTTRVLTSSRLR